MTAPFTSTNEHTVERLGVNRFRVKGPTGSLKGTIQGESTLRALVEYAAIIGITVQPEGYVKPPKPPTPVKNSGIGNAYRADEPGPDTPFGRAIAEARAAGHVVTVC